MTAPLVLIVDDSELLLQMLQMICEGAGYRAVCAESIAAAAALVAGEPPAAILSDLNLPGTADPVAALRALPGLAATPIILISGQDQGQLDAIAAARGAQAAISKDAGLPGMMMALPPLLERLLA
jgi:chemosensory pili system protein ChpA (sensor histidine kinase/response regulator)